MFCIRRALYRGVFQIKDKMNKLSVIRKKKILGVLLAMAIVAVCVVAFVMISNVLMVKIQGKKIVSEADAGKIDAECIMILGAGVRGNSPSPMLRDRLDKGISLYEQGAAPKIIVSGDHGTVQYDEVNVMKKYLIEAGIPDSDIFMDHAGFSTYDSVVRAKKVFGVSRMIVVTQEYHLYRALYICGKNDIDAVGVSADTVKYYGQTYRDIREYLAREKDIFTCLFHMKPKYLGEPIDISGDGNVTNDE